MWKEMRSCLLCGDVGGGYPYVWDHVGGCSSGINKWIS